MVDANVLSLLSKASRLDLLFHSPLVPRCITPTIFLELKTGIERGVTHLTEVLELVRNNFLVLITPNEQERMSMSSLPPVLAEGEAEAIILCQQRNMVFLTHDRKAANYCERTNMGCIRLKRLLQRIHNARGKCHAD